MSTRSTQKIIELIEMILKNRRDRKQLISEFQNLVWSQKTSEPEWAWKVFRDLAYDLDFYVQNPKSRSEDPSYFGDDRAEDEMQSAMRKLREGGLMES